MLQQALMTPATETTTTRTIGTTTTLRPTGAGRQPTTTSSPPSSTLPLPPGIRLYSLDCFSLRYVTNDRERQLGRGIQNEGAGFEHMPQGAMCGPELGVLPLNQTMASLALPDTQS